MILSLMSTVQAADTTIMQEIYNYQNKLLHDANSIIQENSLTGQEGQNDSPLMARQVTLDTENTNSNRIVESSDNYSDLNNLQNQLQNLIADVQSDTGLQISEIYKLYKIQGNKPVYSTDNPDIANECMVKTLPHAFEIIGAKEDKEDYDQVYDKYTQEDEIQRPNEYYLPDTVYNVQSSVKTLVDIWKQKDRQDEQYSLIQDSVKQNLYFYEAVLDYIGEPQENLYEAYKAIIDEKQNHSEVYEYNSSGEISLQSWARDILTGHGYTERQQDILQILWVDDWYIRYASSLDDIISDYEYPFIYGESSIDNLMQVQTSVIAKVRYVWGGGHTNACNIVGIQPVWEKFNTYYINQGHPNNCIMPSYTWCPIHGALTETENACSGVYGDTFSSVQEYIDQRQKFLDTEVLKNGKFIELIENAQIYTEYIQGHSLDGLDCSGYTGWAYNQITGGNTVDSTAAYFVDANRMKNLQVGEQLKPGDIFQWSSHIVMVIGKASDSKNCKAYVIVEMQPYTVQFQVAYYTQASYNDINKAVQIAREANILFGGDYFVDRWVNRYEIETEVITDEVTGEQVVQDRAGLKLGRYTNFIDVDTPVDEGKTVQWAGETFYDMNATEILQHTINKYLSDGNERYLTGLNTYTGSIFYI